LRKMKPPLAQAGGGFFVVKVKPAL
jgi:hypothetical protein